MTVVNRLGLAAAMLCASVVCGASTTNIATVSESVSYQPAPVFQQGSAQSLSFPGEVGAAMGSQRSANQLMVASILPTHGHVCVPIGVGGIGNICVSW